MQNISRYILKIFSVILLIWSNPHLVAAGGEEEKPQKLFYGFSVDFDLSDPFFSMINSNRFGLNASASVDIWHSLFPTIEIGYAQFDGASDYIYLPDLIKQPDNYKYTVNGLYYKIGLDINILSKDYAEKVSPIAYMGVRYVFSPFHYKIENLTMKDFYWNESYSFNAEGSTMGRWVEFTGGVKTPIFRNICMGVSVRFRQFLSVKVKTEDGKKIHNSYVPGFGDIKNDQWGFRYTISYFFPL